MHGIIIGSAFGLDVLTASGCPKGVGWLVRLHTGMAGVSPNQAFHWQLLMENGLDWRSAMLS